MRLIGEQLGRRGGIYLTGAGVFGPGLSLSGSSIVENSAHGAAIGTATPTNASNPGAVSIASQTPASSLQMNVDGRTVEVGAAGLDYETAPSIAVTFQYTDDAGLHQFARAISVTDAPPIQITTGASLDPALMLVGNQIGSAYVAGTYPAYNGNAVSESAVVYRVDDVVALPTYVLQAGDLVGQAEITLAATGADNLTYFSGISGITDFSFVLSDLEWTVPPGGGSVPDAFVLAGWSIADAGTNGDATVTITTLPADNGSALTDLEYRLDGGTAASFGAATIGTYPIAGLPDGTAVNVEVRARNANGPGAWSDVKAVTTTGVPDAFTAGMWTLTDLATGGDARIAIASLPSANGSAITDLQRKIGAGAWTSLGGTGAGNYDVAGFTDGAATNVLVRAVNARGNGADSDTKSVTTTAPSASITVVGTTSDDGPNGANSILDLTAIAGLATGDLVIVVGGNGSGIDTPVNVITGAGWTRLAGDYYINDTFKVNMSVWYKVMTGTPDTGLTLQGASNSTGGGGAIAIALRGVDAVINDVALVPRSGTNTALADPGAITPVTVGAVILALGAASGDTTPVAFTGPANMTGFQQVQAAGSVRSITTFLALKTDWTSGAFDPAPLTGGEDSTSCAWAAVTVALRPA